MDLPLHAHSAMAFSSSLAGIRPLGGFKEDTNSAFGASGSSRARTAAPRPPPLDLPALQHASRALQEQFIKDVQSVPDLGDMLTIRMLSETLWNSPPCVDARLSWRTVFSFLHCLSRRLQSPLPEEKTHRNPSCTMGAFPMCVDVCTYRIILC